MVVLADDLMWSTRLTEAVRRAGASAVALGSAEELAVALEAYELGDHPSLTGAIVDLAARGYDPVAAIESVSAVRLPVIAVAEHDDQLSRKRALKAGASRVFAYRKFFEDGTRLVEGWLAADATKGG